MERNLAYLEDRLKLTVDELRQIVVGYPRILSISLENDLIHTIDFFHDALSRTINDSNVRSLICEMPRLLEYNVAKRLKPRLDRVRLSLLGRDAYVDTEMLRLIATLTDSRFESWLRSLHSNRSAIQQPSFVCYCIQSSEWEQYWQHLKECVYLWL